MPWGQPASERESLPVHLEGVAEAAAALARELGSAEAARVAGLPHDIGRVSSEMRAYLHGRGPSRDHSTAGARGAAPAYPNIFGRMIAGIVAGLATAPTSTAASIPRIRIPTTRAGRRRPAPLPPLEALLTRIAAMDRPLGADPRRLQGYTVLIPPKARAAWLVRGTLVPVHPHLGDALPRPPSTPPTGLRLGDLDRVAEDTLIR